MSSSFPQPETKLLLLVLCVAGLLLLWCSAQEVLAYVVGAGVAMVAGYGQKIVFFRLGSAKRRTAPDALSVFLSAMLSVMLKWSIVILATAIALSGLGLAPLYYGLGCAAVLLSYPFFLSIR